MTSASHDPAAEVRTEAEPRQPNSLDRAHQDNVEAQS